ncbi:MAG: Type 1 glutamine amidotransferase-like domain-containing protein [Firmicutes bacterium]|nr:Type 1 glutamine amidotransferase-like domain-containing protein [Bacillota bacterium]
MGRIVAIFGGSLESTEKLNRYAINLTGKTNPTVLFVPTASKDNAAYIEEFRTAFEKLGAKVETVELARRYYSRGQLQSIVGGSDMVYVGDGNLRFMMKTWKEQSLDEILYRAFKSDSIVLSGLGAGATCWFKCGYSNSDYNQGVTDWNYIWSDELLGIHNVAVCPHYNKNAIRGFDQRIIEKGIPGFAFEDNSAFVQNNEGSRFLKSQDDAHAYSMLFLNGTVTCKEINLKDAGQADEE